jgi:glucokinase
MDSLAGSYLGIEIGGTKLQIVAGDESGRIVHRWRATADRARGGPGICDQILQGVTEIRKRVLPLSIGVGFGGPIDWKTGRIARSHQIDGWEGYELGHWLAEQTGLPIACENDSNLAALAEAIRGAGGGYNPVFYFNLGSGVGGGFIVDGHIYHGLPPGEAEFGHVRLDRSGATVESRCSGWAVDKRVRSIAVEQPQSVLGKAVASTTGGEACALATALKAEDRAALTIINELADDIALGLSHVVHLLHPAVIVMGGGLSLIGEPLRNAVADALPKYIMEVFAPGPPIKSAVLGEDAVPAGALLLAAMQKRINHGDTEKC